MTGSAAIGASRRGRTGWANPRRPEAEAAANHHSARLAALNSVMCAAVIAIDLSTIVGGE